MATHEIYIGGPASANYSRAMFPAPAFNAAGAAFLAVTPSAHKGPVGYQLGRVLDFREDKALQEYVRNAAIVQGDVLGSILIPRNCRLRGMFYHVEREAQTATGAAVVVTITPGLRGGGAFPAIAAGTLDARGYAQVDQAAWTASNAVIDVTDGDWWIHTPTVLDLTLTALTAEVDLTNLRLVLVPHVEFMATGQY